MKEEKKPFSIKAALYTAIITTTFTVLGSLLLVFINQKEPSLQYDILPVSYFKTDSLKITIVNIRIVNSGKKECENISFAPMFGDSLTFFDYAFQKSSLTIQINKIIDSLTHKSYYSIPYLNPNEQVLCSFLFNNIIDSRNISVDLRSKGNVGVQVSKNEPNEFPLVLYFGTIAMLVLTIGLIVFILFHQRKLIRYQLRLQKLEIEARDDILAANGLNWKDLKEKYLIVKKQTENANDLDLED